MSWQSYVDDQLIGTGKIDQACIYSSEKNEVWAKSPGISLINTEYVDLVNGFTHPSKLFATGIYINGVKYATIKADEHSIHGKRGSNGVINVKTNQAIIIGTYNEGMQPGEAVQVVGYLSDYLIESGY